MLRDPEKTKNEIIAWIQKYFEENGPSCTAVIGISGGKDSSVAAALCAQALGKDRVLGVLMPNGVQSDISDSRLLVESIGIPYVEMNIGEAYNAMEKMLSTNAALKEITGTDEMAREAKINLAPRLRMSTLYAVGQMLPQGGRVAGDFSPLSGLMVHEVLQVGACLGLPEQLVQKTPSDGLSGLSDEDKLGFTYAELDHYILTGVCENEEHKKKIDRLHRLNMHKLRLLPRYEPAEDADRRDISKW